MASPTILSFYIFIYIYTYGDAAVNTLLLLSTVTDRKFAVKARLYQALGVTLAVVRSYLHSPKVLQSLVSVLKLYATDGQLTYHHVAVIVSSV